MSGSLTVDELSDFPADAQEWDGLAGRHPAYSVFLSHAWLSAWWRHFGQGFKTRIMTARDRGRLAGMAPLVETATRHRGLTLYRRLSFVEGMETTYRDFIYEAEGARQAIKVFLEDLAVRLDWDVMELWNIRQDSPTVGILGRLCGENGLRCRILPGIAAPYIKLPGRLEDFMKGLRRSVRQNLSRYRRRLEPLMPEFVERETPDQDDIESLMALHQERWSSMGQPGVFGDPAGRNFYREVLAGLSRLGSHRIFQLRAGGKVLAAASRFLYKRTMHSFICGWDMDYSRYGVSKLLIAHSIGRAIEMGLDEYDMSIGDYPYKYDFATGARRNRNVFIFRNLRACLLHGLLANLTRKTNPDSGSGHGKKA
jgi:CelD/BcsL family acetyltransferase involved in cellulose biosynthesis